MEEQQKSNQLMSFPAYMDSSSLGIRLDYAPILRDIRLYLSGIQKIREYDERERKWVEKEIKICDALLTQEGIHSIMHSIESFFNPQVIQGNISEEYHRFIVSSFRMELIKELINHREPWKVDVRNLSPITNKIVQSARLVISRAIDDGERNSYRGTVQHSDHLTQVIPQQKTGWNIPFFGGRN